MVPMRKDSYLLSPYAAVHTRENSFIRNSLRLFFLPACNAEELKKS